MKRIISIFVIFTVLALVLMGCGTSSSEKSEVTLRDTTATVNSSDSDKAYPMTVKDDKGHEMTIKQKPEKIVSLTLWSDEMLISLVDKSRIAALTVYADDPEISNIAEEAKDIHVKLLSEAEKVIALQPDLVITDTWAKDDFVKQLRDAGINVYIFQTPSSIDNVKKAITDLSKLVGEIGKGNEVISWMDKKLKEVQDKVSGLKPEERLTALNMDEMGSTSGKGTSFDDQAARAGLINSASAAGLEKWPQLSKEMVIKFNPDIIIVPGWFYDKNQNKESFIANIKNDKSYSGLKAIVNDKVIALPYNHISSASQYMVLGVEDVAKAAYPELFK